MDEFNSFKFDAKSNREALKLLRTDPVEYFKSSPRQPFGFVKGDEPESAK